MEPPKRDKEEDDDVDDEVDPGEECLGEEDDDGDEDDDDDDGVEDDDDVDDASDEAPLTMSHKSPKSKGEHPFLHPKLKNNYPSFSLLLCMTIPLALTNSSSNPRG